MQATQKTTHTVTTVEEFQVSTICTPQHLIQASSESTYTFKDILASYNTTNSSLYTQARITEVSETPPPTLILKEDASDRSTDATETQVRRVNMQQAVETRRSSKSQATLVRLIHVLLLANTYKHLSFIGKLMHKRELKCEFLEIAGRIRHEACQFEYGSSNYGADSGIVGCDGCLRLWEDIVSQRASLALIARQLERYK